MKELSTERAIEALYTIRAYYASLTAGYPKGKDRRGIGDVMCSEIANSCFMAIKALEQTEPERKPGKWVHMVGWWECNQCHAEYTDMPTCMGKVIYEYCPMCGVKMEDKG